ncbi:hypothetical protein LguiA_030873 [Lonicera macranthoides]
MLSIIHFLPILALFFFLDHSVHTVAGNSPTPHSPIDKVASYEHGHSSIHLVSQDSLHSTSKLRKLAFSSINTIATGLTIVITLLNIIVYKLHQVQEANLHVKCISLSSSLTEQLCHRFSLVDILLATNHFDEALVVGQGGFGKVFKGVIDNGKITVAIKRLNPMSKQGAPEFLAEIKMLSTIRHSNIVSLIGYCDDCDEMILVYEYMIHGTLGDNIHGNGRNGNNSALTWVQRVKLCIGAARGLDYLHTGTGDRNRIIHRDVKSSNILLGENLTAKISDFGMSKIGPTNQVHTHVSTNVKGTFGYMDPEYLLTRQLTRKSDVYAFGVVLFEVLCGRRAVDLRLDEEQRGLAGWAQQCIKEGKVDQIIDPSLRGEIFPDSLVAYAKIADQCLHTFSTKRPTMAEVVVALELALTLQERTDFSLFEEEFFINAELRRAEHIDGIMQSNGASNKDSRVKPAMIMAFAKTMRPFFFGTGRVISAHNDAKLSKNSINSGQIGNSNPTIFTFSELRTATQNFRPIKGLGSVFRGWIDEATHRPSNIGHGIAIAVKFFPELFLHATELQLQSEVEFWGKLSHPNLVKVLGYCLEDDKFLLVREYMRNASLERHLSSNNHYRPLPWVTRLKIATGAARGLAFLHTLQKEFIYYQFKASYIFLDEDFNAKLSDFELGQFGNVSCDLDLDAPTLLTRDVGTYACAYAAPEYKATGQLSLKSDVYGFGVVLLELLTGGLQALDRHLSLNQQDMPDGARPFLINKRKLARVMDPSLKGECPPNCAFEYALLVHKCLDLNPERRPSMEEVLKTLKLQRMDIVSV